jgi:hypothetical protein
MHRFIFALFFLAPIAQADITYIQETYPGGVIVNPNRGYVTMPAGGGFTQVIPTRGGIQDNTRPGYLVGPGISTEPANRMHLDPDGSVGYSYERSVE